MSDFKSKQLLPEYLQDTELYSHVTELIDYAITQYHEEPIKEVRNLYNISSPDFNATQTLKHLGYDVFFSFISNIGNNRAAAAIISNIYDLKGTKKGLRYILRLMGLDATVYEWYDINKWYEEGDPEWPYPVPVCSIVLELSIGNFGFGVCKPTDRWAIPRQGQDFYEGVDEAIAIEDTEAKFAYLASHLLWICTFLSEIRWHKVFEDILDWTDDFLIEDTPMYKDSYSGYRFNCPETPIINKPAPDALPHISPQLVIGAPFLHIWGTGDYEGDYRFCDGYAPYWYIGSHTEGTRKWKLGNGLTLGQHFMTVENGLLSQFVLGQETYITGIAEGTPIINSCSLSVIQMPEYDTSFQTQTFDISKQGYTINPEYAIGSGIRIGTSTELDPFVNTSELMFQDTVPAITSSLTYTIEED